MKVAILSGSVYGTAEELARHAESRLKSAGLDAWHKSPLTLEELLVFDPQALVCITATTGMGELPDNLQPLYFALRDRLPNWRGFPGAVLALGDASYGDTFCGGGELVNELFDELGIHQVLPMLRLDASESVDPQGDAEPWLDQLIVQLQALQNP